MALVLNEESWYNIFSFSSFSYAEAISFCAISKYFDEIIKKHLQNRKIKIYQELLAYHQFNPEDPFWKGLKQHFPIWDLNVKVADVFAQHLLKSLEHSEEDEYRTDRVLFYLGKNKSFMKGGAFSILASRFRKLLLALQVF